MSPLIAFLRRPRHIGILAPLLAIGIASLCNSGCTKEEAPADTRVPDLPPPPAPLTSQDCRRCHQEVFDEWAESDHAHANHFVDRDDRAMFSTAHLPDGASVAFTSGKARMQLQGVHGPEWHDVDMVLARRPLRQALIPWPDGGWQVTQLAWDPVKQDWFDVYKDGRKPGEWGSWTGRGMNWNSSCAFCHMTAFEKNYDYATDKYHSKWKEQAVGCLQCHPAQLASPPPDRSAACAPLAAELVFQNCASCHSRRADFDGAFHAGAHYDDHFLLQLPSVKGIYHPDGQIRDEDYVWTSFRLSRMGHAGVTCADCHNPHSGQTILPIDNNALCLRCHVAPGLNGAPPIDPTAHSHHAAGSTGNRCVECHMPQTVYMQRDARRDHGFLRPDPRLTVELGIPNACSRCHDKGADGAKVYTAAELAQQAETWWGAGMDPQGRPRARALAQAYEGKLASPAPLLALIHGEDNPYWQATYLECLQPWAADPQVVAAATEAAKSGVPRLRAAAFALLAQQPGTGPLRGLDDPSRSVRRAVGIARPDLLSQRPKVDAEILQELRYTADQPSGAMGLAMRAANGGKPQDADKWFKRALHYDPLSPAIPHEYAIFLSGQGRTDDALKELDETIRLAPQDAVPRFHKALALVEKGDMQGAEAALREAVKIEPGFARAHYNLGLLLAQQGDLDGAIASLEAAEAADPTTPDYPYARATLLYRKGDTAGAIAAARKALQASPAYVPALQLLRALGQ